MKVAEGLTQPAHDAIMSKVKILMGTDPTELLPQYRHLLDFDFEQLGADTTVNRQYWIANVETAIKASGRKQGRQDGSERVGDLAQDDRGCSKRRRLC